MVLLAPQLAHRSEEQVQTSDAKFITRSENPWLQTRLDYDPARGNLLRAIDLPFILRAWCVSVTDGSGRLSGHCFKISWYDWGGYCCRVSIHSCQNG